MPCPPEIVFALLTSPRLWPPLSRAGEGTGVRCVSGTMIPETFWCGRAPRPPGLCPYRPNSLYLNICLLNIVSDVKRFFGGCIKKPPGRRGYVPQDRVCRRRYPEAVAYSPRDVVFHFHPGTKPFGAVRSPYLTAAVGRGDPTVFETPHLALSYFHQAPIKLDLPIPSSYGTTGCKYRL
jgi:hypothetical protein